MRSRGHDREGEDARFTAPIEWRRAELGVRLGELRRGAGLTQKQLAERLGVRHPTISRFETGSDMPTSRMLARLADVLAMPEAVLHELADRLAELRIEVRASRLLLRQGVRAAQRQVGEREASSNSVSSYHVALIPGLLQTAEYTRAMAAVLDPEIEVDVDAFVNSRQERQRLLVDPARRFRFVMAEPALRWRVVPIPVLRAQVRRVRALDEGFDHLTIGVIPAAAPITTWTLTGFDIIGDGVEIGYGTGTVMVRDQRDVDVYRRLFDGLDAQAVHGEDLHALLREIDSWLAGLAEGSG
jgi:transcriptional regulator with XRE-family HTH domain